MIRKTRQFFDVTEPPRLGRERVVFAWLGIDIFDLSCDVAQVIGALHDFVTACNQVGFLFLQFRQLPMDFLHVAALLTRPAEGVEDVALRDRPQERLGFVLSVEIYQRATQVRQHTNGSRTAVGPGPIPAFRVDVPPHDEHAFVDLDTGLVRRRVHVRCPAELEGRLDNRPRRTGANDVGTGALAQQQAQRVDEDGFPCPGFARQHVQTGLQKQCRVRDDGEVADTELG